MTRFLHIADIHLGIRRYRMEERTADFFHAWRDCIDRYALKQKVSFVLIAGDFFDTRRVEPVAMNHAMFCLVKLRDAGIPVVVIEGNQQAGCKASRSGASSGCSNRSTTRAALFSNPGMTRSGAALLPTLTACGFSVRAGTARRSGACCRHWLMNCGSITARSITT